MRTDNEPTLSTPLEPTTIPLGDTKIACPLTKLPSRIALTIPLILIVLSTKFTNFETFSAPYLKIRLAISPSDKLKFS